MHDGVNGRRVGEAVVPRQVADPLGLATGAISCHMSGSTNVSPDKLTRNMPAIAAPAAQSASRDDCNGEFGCAVAMGADLRPNIGHA